MIYDIKTTNISFLKLAATLKKHGVKNNKFVLILYDEKLQGIDPRSDTLTPEQKIRIYREICINKWYFLREVVRIPAQGNMRGTPYEANLGNIAFSYMKSKNKNTIMCLPRQHGKTIGEICDDVWCMYFATSGSNMLYLNKDFKTSKENLLRFKEIRLLLPGWLQDEFLVSKDDIDNQERKFIGYKKNSVTALASPMSEDSADRAGRGLTVPLIYFDEFAFLKYNKTVYDACMPAWDKAASVAKKNGVPYGITITTTPNNVDTAAGGYCKEVIDKSVPFDFACYDMDDQQLDDFIENNSANTFVFIQYTYDQLGKDEAWVKKMIKQCQGDVAKIKREVFLEWPISMDDSLFNEETLDNLSKYVKQPITSFLVNNMYPVYFYETPDVNLNYVLSCDVGGGLSHDSSVINIIHPGDFRIVGDFRNNKIDTDNFKKLIYGIMTLYLPNSILIIERNSYGLNIIQSLMKDPLIEPRMYREVKEQLGEKQQRDGVTIKRKTKNVVYGVDTTSKSRDIMISMLPEIVESEAEKLVSPYIQQDIRGIQRKKNGRIEHYDGGHDDNLMAYLIFRYAVHHGKCFRDKFGISPVPSEHNVKVVSSQTNMGKISEIIQNANLAAELGDRMQSAMDVMYRKMVSEFNSHNGTYSNNNGDEERQLNFFNNICNLNGNL